MDRPFNTERLVLGLTILWVGIVATLGNLGKMDALFVLHRWWPWTLLAWGALDLLRVRNVRRLKSEQTAAEVTA